MEHQEYSVGLDIGTTKIVALVGRYNQLGKIEVMGLGVAKSLGVQNGIVNNVSRTIDSIKKAVELAEKSAKVTIKKVTVGIAGKHIRSLQHSDYIMRENPDEYITEKDIEALKEQVKKLVMLPGEQIIHVLPQEYKVDSEGDIKDPIGMHGKRLEANFHVVVGRISNIKNIARCVKEAGLEMVGLTLEPLASAESVLTKDEREAGVAIVDIGGGTTDIAIFKDHTIKHTCVIPYAGGIITHDIKEGCSILERDAEILKVKYGSALPEMEQDNVVIAIKGLGGRPNKEISQKALAQIIHARLEEILTMVNSELITYGVQEPKKKLIAGVVLTGGGSNLKHLRQLFNFELGIESRIGFANEYIANDKEQILKNPSFATSIGLLMEGLRNNANLVEEEEEKQQETTQQTQQEPTREEAKETVLEHKEKRTAKKESIGQIILKKIKEFLDDTE
ncbi:cell division protein FtsA [Riemerella columbina]|uniref:cell division protein FtsA n=1 Tax=Riemerella columbina TaxID=103810 RepID=UPI00266F8088|nr:cell division protein FtsA [Riemerella columbina]WKS95380.1 cell division protein FtsA [Riemerella columbina]